MSEKPIKISALAIVFNEEHNIRAYLENMSFADEIVVVDSFSTDNTPKIIQEEFPNVRFYQRAFDDFSSQRNYTLDLAANDWVTFFDADEKVIQKGIDEIVSAINAKPEEVALWVKRIFYYEGKPFVNSKFNEDRTARIFRRSKCRYDSDKLVHEKLTIKGKSRMLKYPIHHYSFNNKEEFLRKRLQYSKLKAKELLVRNIKPNLYHYIIRPTFRFFKYYILKLGFFDGRRGYEIAKILGYDEYMRYVYLEEMQKSGISYYAKPNSSILVIQQKMIGDVLASTIICNNLKKMYPQAKVDYLIYPFTKPVVENNPNIDELVLFEPRYRKNRTTFLKFLLSMRKRKYDVVIDAYGILESNLIVSFIPAKKKIGFFKSYTSYLYTDTVKELKQPLTDAGLALDNRMQLLKVLDNVTPLDSKPVIYLTPEEIAQGRQLLEDHGITTDKKIYMISVLGSGSIKTYPLAYMAQLLDVIAAKSNAVMLFNYIPSQQKEADTIYGLCNEVTKQKIRMDIMPGSVREFLGVLHHCDALIGNEGGAVNMAKALNVPTFSIFSTWIKKEAWNSFEDGRINVSVHLKDLKPHLYGEKSAKEMKPQALELYKEFTPDLIIPELERYITIN